MHFITQSTKSTNMYFKIYDKNICFNHTYDLYDQT
jgi:hypothetical protein